MREGNPNQLWREIGRTDHLNLLRLLQNVSHQGVALRPDDAVPAMRLLDLSGSPSQAGGEKESTGKMSFNWATGTRAGLQWRVYPLPGLSRAMEGQLWRQEPLASQISIPAAQSIQ